MNEVYSLICDGIVCFNSRIIGSLAIILTLDYHLVNVCSKFVISDYHLVTIIFIYVCNKATIGRTSKGGTYFDVAIVTLNSTTKQLSIFI